MLRGPRHPFPGAQRAPIARSPSFYLRYPTPHCAPGCRARGKKRGVPGAHCRAGTSVRKGAPKIHSQKHSEKKR